MKIEPATYDDVLKVALDMRERDYQEFLAVSWAEDRLGLASDLAERYGRRPDIMCGWHDNERVCIGGIIEGRPHVATLLFFATEAFPKVLFGLTRFIRRELFPRLEDAGVHRIEAVSKADNTDAQSWLTTIGLSQETQPMPGYGRGGESYIQYAKVIDVRPPGA